MAHISRQLTPISGVRKKVKTPKLKFLKVETASYKISKLLKLHMYREL